MKKFRYLVATLMIAAIVAVVLAGCKKEKSNETQSNNGDATEEVVRKPIATRDMKTGEITYSLSMEDLQACFDKVFSSKGENNNYIIESVQIEGTNAKDSDDSMLVISAIDTESEKAYKTCLNKGFIDEVEENGTVIYYFENDFESGNFSLFSRNYDGTFEISFSNFQIINIISVSDSVIDYSANPKVTITCESQGCPNGGCSVYKDMYNNPQGCTDCGATGAGVYCKKTIVYNEPNWFLELMHALSNLGAFWK